MPFGVSFKVRQKHSETRVAERRQIISLGREPQEQSAEKHYKPRSGDRCFRSIAAADAAAAVCRPFRAADSSLARYLGLTPQAMDLSPLRGSQKSFFSGWP